MNDNDWLAERFEEQRPRLQGVAYRMLGSLTEADDAVQEAWLRLSRSEADEIENLHKEVQDLLKKYETLTDEAVAKKSKEVEEIRGSGSCPWARRCRAGF